jgi:adenosylhomocysteine nucleosidase
MKMNLVICPMPEELEELMKKVKTYKAQKIGPIEGFAFAIGGEDYFAFLGKIGKANIGFDLGCLSNLVEIHKIYNIGVAGSLKDDLVPLNVVVADKVCYYDCDLTSAGSSKYKLGQMAGEELYFPCDEESLKAVKSINTTLTVVTGTIISGDSFATKSNITKDLLSHFDNPLAVDMESGACGQMAHRLGVPFTVIRAISDNVFAEGNNSDVFYEFVNLSARRAASVFMHIVNKEFIDAAEDVK